MHLLLVLAWVLLIIKNYTLRCKIPSGSDLLSFACYGVRYIVLPLDITVGTELNC